MVAEGEGTNMEGAPADEGGGGKTEEPAGGRAGESSGEDGDGEEVSEEAEKVDGAGGEAATEDGATEGGGAGTGAGVRTGAGAWGGEEVPGARGRASTGGSTREEEAPVAAVERGEGRAARAESEGLEISTAGDEEGSERRGVVKTEV